MARIHSRTIQKSLNDLKNYNGVATYLEPNVLECEVKWTLGSSIKNKASRVDEIAAKLLKNLKDDAFKVLQSIYQ